MTSDGVDQRVSDQVSMPLLTRITQQSLDEDYQHAADRRVRSGETWTNGRRLSRSTAAVVALFGVIVTTAFVQTSRDASEAASSRAGLITAVGERSDQVAELESRLRELRQQNIGLQSSLESATQSELAQLAQIERLRAIAGFLPVTGPGVRIVVDDAPGGDDSGRIRDEDLAILVDGLWNAGAEAISINGQRLTALAPIRSSGIAIHVNNKPISPPYVVLAIGDKASLQSRFADSTHGLAWLALKDSFDFGYDVQNEDLLEIPGARLPLLRAAGLSGADYRTGKTEVTP